MAPCILGLGDELLLVRVMYPYPLRDLLGMSRMTQECVSCRR